MRVKTRMDQLRSEGYFVGGQVLYGYRMADHGRRNRKDEPVFDLEIAPQEAAVVREIFQQAIEGDGPSAIARKLNAKGLCTRQGNAFQRQNVKRIL